jgi:hypothetical protein
MNRIAAHRVHKATLNLAVIMRFAATTSIVLVTVATIATGAPVAGAASGLVASREIDIAKPTAKPDIIDLGDNNKQDRTIYRRDIVHLEDRNKRDGTMHGRDIVHLEDRNKRDKTRYEARDVNQNAKRRYQFGGS